MTTSGIKMTTAEIKMVPWGEKKNIYIHYLRGRLCENEIFHTVMFCIGKLDRKMSCCVTVKG